MSTLAPLRHPAVDAVLSAASTLLGMEVVFIGGLTADAFTFEKVHAVTDWPGLYEGRAAARTDSLCHRLLAGAPCSTVDASTDPGYRDAAVLAELAIRSYVGVPVRNSDGEVVATLCGVDRGEVVVDAEAVAVLQRLAEVVESHLVPAGGYGEGGIVIRRSPAGGWAVGAHATGDLTSAMVLADLLAEDIGTAPRPSRSEDALDEVAQLRLSVRQLEHALAARVAVEQAIGVLTERQGNSPRDAFERLRKVARSRGRKVHDLAREVVASASDHAVPLPPELAGRR